jgi:hypothetical protein
MDSTNPYYEEWKKSATYSQHFLNVKANPLIIYGLNTYVIIETKRARGVHTEC